jgi:LacI family transcriptional regulator
LNRKSPEEVAILGCGNDEIICQIAQPQLSSIDLKTQEVGFRAAELLDQLMGRKVIGDTSSHFARNQEIVVRGSSDRYSLVNKDVATAMQYIRAHSNEAIYVPDVVRVSGVSRRKLEVLFQKHVGRGIYQEIRSSHIAIARRLLTSTTLPLSEICRRSGFNNVSALECAISQSEGCTAGELRAKHAVP